MQIPVPNNVKNWSPVLSLHKYFTWAETMRVRFNALVIDNPPVAQNEA
jgi:hypothetical protein